MLMQSPPGAVTKIDGREYLYFAGTGYLGLQGHPEVIRAACQAAEQYGIGSANSRIAFGTTPPLLDVERLAAAMFGLDDAFYFASGWMGNNILVPALAEDAREEASKLVLVDECSHYSVMEAARLSGWPSVTFAHRDADDLRSKLKENLKPGQPPLVLSDGVFAATGRIAPVGEYCGILADYPESMLCLDDAHGVAVLGDNGRGTFEHAGLWSRGVNVGSARTLLPALLFSGTLSKAVGGFGGIIPGDGELIRRVKLRSPYLAGGQCPARAGRGSHRPGNRTDPGRSRAADAAAGERPSVERRPAAAGARRRRYARPHRLPNAGQRREYAANSAGNDGPRHRPGLHGGLRRSRPGRRPAAGRFCHAHRADDPATPRRTAAIRIA